MPHRARPAPPGQLIGALVPTSRPRRVPPPVPQALLPARRAVVLQPLLVDLAHMDASGRVSARRLLRALAWPIGQPMVADVVEGLIVVTSAAGGRHRVGSRGDLPLPAAARRLCALDDGQAVVLAADPPQGLLVIHPLATLAGLLRTVHTRLLGGDHDR